MWVSDHTVVPRFSWSELLNYIQTDPDISVADKAWILGGSARDAYFGKLE